MHSIVLNKTQQEWVTVSERETKASETGIGGSLVYRQLEIPVYTTGFGDSLVYRQLEISVYTTGFGGSLVNS